MRTKTQSWFLKCGMGWLMGIAMLFLFTGIPPRAMDGPEVVEIDRLANVYEGVMFQHAMHTELAACAACHHHTTGTPPEDPDCIKCHKTGITIAEVACSSCHQAATPVGFVHEAKRQGPDPYYHMERTGLRRAYHQGCINCHKQMGAPAGCTDCHAKHKGVASAQ